MCVCVCVLISNNFFASDKVKVIFDIQTSRVLVQR